MHLFRTYYVSIINTLHIFISFNPLKNPEESIVLLSSFTLKQTEAQRIQVTFLRPYRE